MVLFNLIDINKAIGTRETYIPEEIKSYAYKKAITSIATLEKAIFCLEYLGQLQKEGLAFIFKGGSAVQILLGDRWTRLSIDIDICTNSPKKEIEDTLEKIYEKFSKKYFSYEVRPLSLDSEIPFYSYRIETPALTDANRTILLDIMGTEPKFPTRLIPLRTSFFQSSEKIRTPTKGALLGDKLSTIGPTTMGRSLNNRRNGLEYVKHLYDINNLLESDYKLEECICAYDEAVKTQSIIRKKKFKRNACVSDLTFTCQVASLPESIGQQLIDELPEEIQARGSLEYENLSNGLRDIRPFLGQAVTYTNEKLRIYAAQAALIAELICNNAQENEAKEYLNPDFPSDPKQINKLVKSIEELPKEERWFIDIEEITNYPRVLKLWHSFFDLKGLLSK